MILYDNDSWREEFMDIVYQELSGDPTNDRANRIIDAYDSVPAVNAITSMGYHMNPLSKDELLHVEEQIPIYVMHRYGAWQQNGWHIWNPEIKENDTEIADLENYGITWDAYLIKPYNM
jgi:hypothetical protein